LRNHGDFGIGDKVKTPKGVGTVLGRSDYKEYLSVLPEFMVEGELARIRSAYGDEWRRLFSNYSVEVGEGVEFFESGKLEAADESGY